MIELPTTRISRSPAETEAIGVELAELGPRLFLLVGDLGAGKTVLVRGLARGFGVDPDEVVSPTFALLNEYGDDDGSCLLRHLDLYRVGSVGELEETGLFELLEEDVPVAVEWPDERLLALRNAIEIRIEPGDDDSIRRIEIRACETVSR